MHSTLTATKTNPHDVFVTDPEVVLAARADHAPSIPTHDEMSRLLAPKLHAAQGVNAAAPAPSLDATFRAAAVEKVLVDRPAMSRLTKRVIMALIALCSAVGAAAWQHYGDAAKQTVANWAPSFMLAASPSADKPALAAQPNSPAGQQATADQATPTSAPSVQPAQATAAAATAALPESTTLLQSMARDLATTKQQIEQLKADIDQLKTGQSQLSRDIARTSEARASETRASETRASGVGASSQVPPPRLSAAPTRPAAAAAHKPRPAVSPVQAAATPALPAAPPLPPPAAAAPLQSAPPAPSTSQPDAEPIVRPPLPLR